jgi:hypothetical protein
MSFHTSCKPPCQLDTLTGKLTPANVGLADGPPSLCVAKKQENDRALDVCSGLQFAAGNTRGWWWFASSPGLGEQVGELKTNGSHHGRRSASGEAVEQYAAIITFPKAQRRATIIMGRASSLIALAGLFHLVQVLQDVVDHDCTPVTRPSQDATASGLGDIA